jgi:NADH-quinone oxidoreductase subunit J
MALLPAAIESVRLAPVAAIAIPAALGMTAIYLLLPRPRPLAPGWGAAVACLALLTGGWFLIRFDAIDPEAILFCAFSGLAIVSAGLLVTQRNPVHAALSFALVVLSTCGLFLLQAAPFLMAATLIVYAGAIVVTFLFVIMLAQQAGLSNADSRSREPLLSVVAGFVLAGTLLYALHIAFDPSRAGALALEPAPSLRGTGPRPTDYTANGEDGRAPLPADNVAHLGRSLFTDFLIPVELAGTLLLVATVGAIVIAARRTEGLR